MDRLFVSAGGCQGRRVGPEWYWRDFRLRLRRGAIIAQSHVWNGRRYSGLATTTSSPLNGDQNVNAIIGILGKVPSKSPECPPEQ